MSPLELTLNDRTDMVNHSVTLESIDCTITICSDFK